VSQNGLDGSHTVIVMGLLGELSTHEVVDRRDLLRKSFVFFEAFRHELDLGNGLEVWHHHGNRSEQSSQVVWKFLTTGIAWVHRDEQTSVTADVQLYIVDYGGRHVSLSDCSEHCIDVSGDDGEYIEQDSVELIEATPGARLGKTNEGLTQALVRHLWRAILNDHIVSQVLAQILDGLSLTGTSWSLWRSTSLHIESIGQSHVSSISEWSNDETAIVSLVLVTVLVLEVKLLASDVHLLLLVLVVVLEESQLTNPSKGVRIGDTLVIV
jgi:hypothetical protein